MILDSPAKIREYTDKGWWGHRRLHDYMHDILAAKPDEIALVDPFNRDEIAPGPTQRLTYAKLAARIDRLACGLLDLGVGKDDIVLVQLPNIVELAYLYLVASRLGAILSPLPVQFRTHELKHVLDLTNAGLLITTQDFGGFDYVAMAQGLQPDHPGLQTIIALGDELPSGVVAFEDLARTPADADRLAAHDQSASITANDILTICWTSGTEAEPKGVPRSHNHWIAIALATVDSADLAAEDHLLNPFPLVSMAAIGGMLVPWLLTGGRLVMHQPFNLPVFLQQIKTEGIHYTVAPPVLLTMLLMKPEILASADLSSLKTIGSGSTPLSPWMVRQWEEEHGIPVLNYFGSNEGTAFVAGKADIPDPEDRARYFPRFGTPGLDWQNRVAQGMSTRLVDPLTDEEVTAPTMIGEMAIQGPTIFPGYYRRPGLTAKAFDDQGYYRTGDLFAIAGEADRLDRYHFVGRLRDLIIRGGMKIAPEEIEFLLAGHDKIAEVAIIGVPTRVGDETVCAVVVPKEGQEVSLADLTSFLRQKDVARYKLPRRLEVVSELPRNALGKVLKRVLREQLQLPGTDIPEAV